MTDWLKLLPAGEVRRILGDVEPVEVERVSLRGAAGRVLAEPLRAPHDVPAARLSAMDGYAVRAQDVAGVADAGGVALRVIASIAAGTTYAGRVERGQAVGIPTGGAVPDGADAVVMVEMTESSTYGKEGRAYAAPGSDVRVLKAVAVGANVIPVGDDLRAGAEVLARGRRLRAGDLAALASFGVVDVPVFRRPRIAVLATGSEICPPEEVPRPGQVRDSNQYVLCAEVESTGCIAVPGGIVGDDAGLLRETVLRLVDENDGLILSGGSSVGPKDLTAQVFGHLAAPGILFHGINIRPGKPTVFARAGRKPVVGMPGYPTSSMVVFEAFIRSALARLGGEQSPEDRWASAWARLARAYHKPAAREDYLRVRLTERAGELWAEALPGGSAAISNVIFADGLARIPDGVEHLDEGAPVAVRRFG